MVKGIQRKWIVTSDYWKWKWMIVTSDDWKWIYWICWDWWSVGNGRETLQPPGYYISVLQVRTLIFKELKKAIEGVQLGVVGVESLESNGITMVRTRLLSGSHGFPDRGSTLLWLQLRFASLRCRPVVLPDPGVQDWKAVDSANLIRFCQWFPETKRGHENFPGRPRRLTVSVQNCKCAKLCFHKKPGFRRICIACALSVWHMICKVLFAMKEFRDDRLTNLRATVRHFENRKTLWQKTQSIPNIGAEVSLCTYVWQNLSSSKFIGLGAGSPQVST